MFSDTLVGRQRIKPSRATLERGPSQVSSQPTSRFLSFRSFLGPNEVQHQPTPLAGPPARTYCHPEFPLLLCRVSKSWKDFVYGTPLIWRFLSIDSAKHRTIDLQVLPNQLSRAQNVPLVVSFFIWVFPNLDAPRILFSFSHQFCELSLMISNPLWWYKMSLTLFGTLEKLTARTWPMVYDLPELSSVFITSSSLLECPHRSRSTPAYQLRSLDLTVCLDVIQAFDVLAACPNLRFASISLLLEIERSPEPKQIVLRNLIP